MGAGRKEAGTWVNESYICACMLHAHARVLHAQDEPNDNNHTNTTTTSQPNPPSPPTSNNQNHSFSHTPPHTTPPDQKNNKQNQAYYVCRTCRELNAINQGANVGCCLPCAAKCHRGHDLEARPATRFYCDWCVFVCVF